MVVFGGKIAMILGLGAVLVAGRNFWEMKGLRVMGAAERDENHFPSAHLHLSI